MYIRRKEDTTRCFVRRGAAHEIRPGDGFTLVLDAHLWSLQRYGFANNLFDSVTRGKKQQHASHDQEEEDSDSEPTLLKKKRPNGSTDTLTTNKQAKSTQSAPSTSSAFVDLDEDDVQRTSSPSSGSEKPKTKEEIEAADAELARQLQDQFDQADQQELAAAEAKKASQAKSSAVASVPLVAPRKKNIVEEDDDTETYTVDVPASSFNGASQQRKANNYQPVLPQPDFRAPPRPSNAPTPTQSSRNQFQSKSNPLPPSSTPRTLQASFQPSHRVTELPKVHNARLLAEEKGKKATAQSASTTHSAPKAPAPVVELGDDSQPERDEHKAWKTDKLPTDDDDDTILSGLETTPSFPKNHR